VEEETFVFQMQIDLRAFARLNPILGVLYTPFDEKLKIGLTYREKTRYKIGPINLIMNYGSGVEAQAGVIPWNATVDFYFAYQPQEWALGVAYDFDPFTISFGLEFQKWSKFDWSYTYQFDYYPPDQRLKGYTPNGPEFDDVYNMSVGIEYKYNDDITIMAGYQNAPTPVPDQTGRITNYLDMDKDIFSVGATYVLKEDFIKIGGMFQYMLCDDYEVYKDGVKGLTWPGPEPGVYQDDYEVSGDVYVVGILMEINF
jgi:long-subunit fatty acid transport protein